MGEKRAFIKEDRGDRLENVFWMEKKGRDTEILQDKLKKKVQKDIEWYRTPLPPADPLKKSFH